MLLYSWGKHRSVSQTLVVVVVFERLETASSVE